MAEGQAEYRCPAEEASASITVERSTFNAQVFPVKDEAQVLERLKQVRATNPKARHTVWAYLLHDGRSRASDDGEPQGTAGKPTLAVIEHSGLLDIAVLTTRYFGGVLLGAGGLVRAYTSAAQAALAQTPVATFALCTPVHVRAPYALYERLTSLATRHGATIESPTFAQDVSFDAVFQGAVPQAFLDAVRETTAGSIAPEVGSPVQRKVPSWQK